MTLTIRDVSDFDADPISLAGLSGLTHKATEGTSIVHQQYGPRLNAWRGQVPVLGAYHVLRTPGSSGAGSLAAQLDYWVSRMDSQTPWWRDYPWILQIDAEQWPYDNVQPSTVLAFADLVATSGLPGWKVTYASRGQYGDGLTGIATALWNADYRGGASYPGDGWTSVGGAPAGWAPYSGQVPVLLQWTSGPDLNAFRGSLEELLALTTGGTVDGFTDQDRAQLGQIYDWISAESARVDAVTYGLDTIRTGPYAGKETMWLVTAVKDVQTKLAALAIPAPAPVDPAALKAVLLDPEVLAAIAKAVNDNVSQRMQA